MRRIIAVVVAAAGLSLIVTPFALSLFSRASAAESLSAAVRPSMTKSGLAALRSDFDVAYAAGDEFIQKTIPAVAGALHQTPAELNAAIATSFPHVATGVERWYAMSDDARRNITTIETHRTQFEAADSIPTKSIPLRAGPWGFLALGVPLLAAGVLLSFDRSAASALVALTLGAVAIAAPLALSLQSKASATNDVYASLRNVLSRQEVDQLQVNLGVVQEMVPELTGKMIPFLEGKLGMSAAEFNSFVAQNFPAVSKGLASFEPILARMSARVAVMDAGVPLYAQTSKIPFNALAWLFFIPGAVAVIGAGVALRPAARRVRTEEIAADDSLRATGS